MKTIFLIKQVALFEDGNKKVTVLNAFSTKEAAERFVNEMIDLDNQMKLKTLFSYQIVKIKLYE